MSKSASKNQRKREARARAKQEGVCITKNCIMNYHASMFSLLTHLTLTVVVELLLLYTLLPMKLWHVIPNFSVRLRGLCYSSVYCSELHWALRSEHEAGEPLLLFFSVPTNIMQLFMVKLVRIKSSIELVMQFWSTETLWMCRDSVPMARKSGKSESRYTFLIPCNRATVKNNKPPCLPRNRSWGLGWPRRLLLRRLNLETKRSELETWKRYETLQLESGTEKCSSEF